MIKRLKLFRKDAMSPPACKPLAPSEYPDSDTSAADVFMDILQGAPMPTIGKRVLIGPVAGTDAADAREAVECQRDDLLHVLVSGMVGDAAALLGIDGIPYQHGRYALVVLVVSETWHDAVSALCSETTGCRLVRGISKGVSELDHGVAVALAGGRNAALVVKSLAEVPAWVAATADAVLHLRAPEPYHLMLALDQAGAGGVISEDDLFDVDLDAVGSAAIRAAWRTPDPVLNAQRLLRALRAYTPPAKVRAPGFESLHGLPEAVAWGKRLAGDLSDYRDGAIPWEDVDGGVLVSGPPGVGKTRFAAALASECGVPLVQGSLAAWQGSGDGHLGSMLKAMASTFSKARAAAPCIMFLDELDGIGNRACMSGHSSEYFTQVINALLEHLDGLQRRNGVVIVGATNFPDSIDAALCRAGRLDRHIRLSLPDPDARVLILAQYAGVSPEDAQEPARGLAGCSGAELEAIARDARRLAREGGVPVRPGHLRAAAAARQAEAVSSMVDLAAWDCGTAH